MDLKRYLRTTPVFTRRYILYVLIISLLSQLDLISPGKLAFDWNLVLGRYQVSWSVLISVVLETNINVYVRRTYRPALFVLHFHYVSITLF